MVLVNVYLLWHISQRCFMGGGGCEAFDVGWQVYIMMMAGVVLSHAG
jgi:hypothetical protein